MEFQLTYKTGDGNHEEKIKAESEEEAKIKAEEIIEKIIEQDKTACNFELSEITYTLTLGERVKPNGEFLDI